ncbi:MAG: hypothetical protein LC753_18785 [Acidobacteria bacterium]|nr:hypothetical protein [Acidobacteriota bacterium]
MRGFIFTVALLVTVPSIAPAQPLRPLKVDDIFAFKNVGDPRVSPDGAWIAYTVSQMDQKKDASDTDIYMVPRRRRSGCWIAAAAKRRG